MVTITLGWTFSILFAVVSAGVLDGPGQPLTPENFQDAWDVPNDNQAHEEFNPNLYEGDIQLSDEERAAVKGGVSLRNVINTDDKKWPKDSDGYVRIPYKVDAGFSKKTRDWIARAILEINGKTCIRLVPWSGQRRHYILYSIEYDDFGGACSSPTGMQWNVNGIRLGSGDGCGWGGILHETMHTLGFFHEHTRLDRDDWIKINWNHVPSGMEPAFKKCGWVPEMQAGCRALKTPYDYDSIMHYSNTLKYFTPLKPMEGKTMGQRYKLSTGDIKSIEEFYNCSPGMGDPTIEFPPSTTPPPKPTEDPETLARRCEIYANLQICSMVDWHCPPCGVE